MGTKRIYEIQRASEVTPDDVFLVERPDGSGGYATYSATGRQIAQGLARAADPGPAPAYADPAYATAEIPFTCLDGGRTLSAPSDATVFGGAGWDEGQFLDSFCVRYPGDEEFSRLQWAKPVPGGGYALDVPRGTEISCPGSVGWGGAAYIRAAAWALEAGGRAPLLSFRLSSDGSAQYAHSPAASFAAAPGLSVRARILVEGEDGGEWRYRLLLQASNSAGRDLPVSVPPSCLVSRRGEWAAPDEDDQSQISGVAFFPDEPGFAPGGVPDVSAAEVSALGAIPQTPAGAFVDFAEVIGGARPPVSGDSQYALSCLYMPDGVRPAPSQESPFFYSLQFAEPLVVEVDPLSACVGRRS